MQLNHIGLFCSKEEKSDLFYGKILGLEKLNTKEVPAALVKRIFDIDRDLRIINYGNDDVRIEIFVGDLNLGHEKNVNHLCLDVAERESFLNVCETHGVEIRKIPKGDYMLVFIRDFDGNLFEIKEKQ